MYFINCFWDLWGVLMGYGYFWSSLISVFGMLFIPCLIFRIFKKGE